jgi:hypothetical protein
MIICGDAMTRFLRFLLLAFLLGLVVGKHSVRPWRGK